MTFLPLLSQSLQDTDRKPERVTQNAGPTELGCSADGSHLQGQEECKAGWSGRLPEGARGTAARPERTGGLGGGKSQGVRRTESIWET